MRQLLLLTLLMLLGSAPIVGQISMLPLIHIADAPRFAYRGFILDTYVLPFWFTLVLHKPATEPCLSCTR